MRFLMLPVVLALAPGLAAQLVLDGPFINERFILNVPASPLEGLLPDEGFVRAHSTALRDYTLDEPRYWTMRTFHRIFLDGNPALTAVHGASGPVTLLDVINTGIRAGQVTLFRDLTFLEPLEQQAYLPLMGASLLLKTDFAYNDSTHRVEAHLIGLAVEAADGTARCMYFPELRHVLRTYTVAADAGTIGLDAWFDRWMFIAHAVDPVAGGAPEGCTNCTMVHEAQAELDALVRIFLIEHELAARAVPRRGRRSFRVTSHDMHQRSATAEFNADGTLQRAVVRKGKRDMLIINCDHGVPHGAFREFRADGGLKQQGQFEHGLREGPWTAWWENGNIRSRRQYAAGRLEATQRVYHPNGQLRTEYGMQDGEQSGAYSAFDVDGGLIMQGRMVGGLVDGDWNYRIRIDRELQRLLDERRAQVDMLPEVWSDGVIAFDMRYTRDPDAPTCPLHTCIRSERIGGPR
jgi:hypothetical protein